MNQSVSFGARLREERLRLGLSQTAFGEIAGITKKTQVLYESGERTPDMLYLAAVSKAGVDYGYVLTGQRTSSSLLSVVPSPPPRPDFNAEEARLLSNFRGSSAEGRAAILATSRLAASAPHAHPPSRRRRSG